MIHILILDADDMSCAMLADNLRKHSRPEFLVTTAKTVEEAQQHAMQLGRTFDISLINQQLASM